jgi:outer membrane lipopolysaccharide assembly protein LptE/RlpB
MKAEQGTSTLMIVGHSVACVIPVRLLAACGWSRGDTVKMHRTAKNKLVITLAWSRQTRAVRRALAGDGERRNGKAQNR